MGSSHPFFGLLPFGKDLGGVNVPIGLGSVMTASSQPDATASMTTRVECHRTSFNVKSPRMVNVSMARNMGETLRHILIGANIRGRSGGTG